MNYVKILFDNRRFVFYQITIALFYALTRSIIIDFEQNLLSNVGSF